MAACCDQAQALKRSPLDYALLAGVFEAQGLGAHAEHWAEELALDLTTDRIDAAKAGRALILRTCKRGAWKSARPNLATCAARKI